MRARKWQRIPRFDDSGVVMGSSQDHSVIPPSSPPALEWTGRSPVRIDDPEPPSTGQDDSDEKGDSSGDDTRFIALVGSPNKVAPSILDRLRERLEQWCQACPVCYLAGDFKGEIHQIRDC